MIKGLVDSVREWQHGNVPPPTVPKFPHKLTRELRSRLLAEEFQEYTTAEYENDIVGLADALGDMMYVIVGTALLYGIPLDAVVKEICASNDTKKVDGEFIYREDGKIMKPESYVPPNLNRVLFYQTGKNYIESQQN